MNIQGSRPKTWIEWKDSLQEAINLLEIDIVLLKAQLKEAETHT